MIFEKIHIWNLFSYYGEQTFDFPAPTEERPIILIAGRNGYGKTSFINSVKLLFLGTADDMLKSVQVGRTLRPNSYLLGADREWRGVFNQKAVADRVPGSRFGIAIHWREEQGRVQAERYWTLDGTDPEAHLLIRTDFDTDFGRVISEPEDAEEFLERRLPHSVVPFFFYDGEQVQQIAEANREGQLRQIERLLDIAAIDTLHDYLGRAIQDWKRGGLAQDAIAEQEKLLAEKRAAEAAKEALLAHLADAEAEIANLEREIRRHERQADILRAKSLQRDEPKLRQRAKEFADAYESICQKIAAELPTEAPLWASPILVARVSQAISDTTANTGQLLSAEVAAILARLPEQLLEVPPHPTPQLSDSQKAHLRRKLENISRVYTDTPGSGFFSLSVADTLALKRRIDYFQQAAFQRRQLVEDLRHASRLRQDLADAKAALDAVNDISPEEQQLFRQRQDTIAQANSQRDDWMEKKGGINKELASAEQRLVQLNKAIDAGALDIAKRSIDSRRIERARQAQRLFENYKQQLKQTRRQQIEEAINHRFHCLMTSHGQIQRIELDEDFAMTYRNAQGAIVGMANISSGMKQLAAQALLWALSEATSRDVPVIVDTPLARIDREHQENLLKNYYPNACTQVFILPTNSELDAEKYQLIAPHIAAEFRLENDSGDHTQVRAGVSMFPVRGI